MTLLHGDRGRESPGGDGTSFCPWVIMLDVRLSHPTGPFATIKNLTWLKSKCDQLIYEVNQVLTQIKVKNFKSYSSGTLQLATLTVLIGANASEKNNVIEALHLLARIAEGERLGFINIPYKQDENIFRGRVENFGYRGSKSFGISCVTTEPEWKDFSINFSLRDDGESTCS